MEELLLKCINLSIRASYMILAVLLIRMIFAKAEKKYMVWMWILVGIRLICPLSIPALPSVLPPTEVIPEDIALSHTPQIASGIQAVDQTVNPVLQQHFTPAPADSANPLQVVNAIASAVWIAGMIFMFGYMIVSSLLLKRMIRKSGPLHQGIAESKQFEGPFVFGMIHPIICLPPCEEEKKKMILLHERTHIERKDHILKPLAFIILSVYWFNPLVWLAYRLLCRDIEMACDEAVIAKMARRERSCYAETLLSCASSGLPAASPVAFGETDVKKRIKNILKYRKPSAVLAACLIISALAVSAGCFADQKTEPQKTEPADSQSQSGNTDGKDGDKKEDTAGRETPDTKTVITVESLLQNPSAYVNTYVYVQGNLPQSISGTDESGKPIVYLSGVNDLNQHIRLIDEIPQDGACLVEAYGDLVYLDNGELALSLDGYEVLSQESVQPAQVSLTVESLLQNPSPYVNQYVYIQGNLPQSIAGFDAGGNAILYLCGAEDLNQHIRIINYKPTDGSCLVEAYGTIVYLDNGELAISMDGYTVLSQQSVQAALTVESLIQNPSAYVNQYVHIQGNLPQSIAGFDASGNAILYLCGAEDLNQHIRIVDYKPTDGSCLVDAYGMIVYLDNGELAISMEGYDILQ